MSLIWLVVIVLAAFSACYLGYSRYLARFLEIDDARETPAWTERDGREYVPARKLVLAGHHFSSVAGGAPIIGPIVAALTWGWVPALAWIVIGNPLIGAVHDYVATVGSLRHRGQSIGVILGHYLGRGSRNALLWFAFLAIILVVAVFAWAVAVVFDAYPQAATASLLYIGLALAFGVWMQKLRWPFGIGSVVFVALVFASVAVGQWAPLALFPSENVAEVDHALVLFSGAPPLPALVNANVTAWVPVILVYGFVASVLPVWLLLQPRDYLSSFLLYVGIGGTLLAVVVGTVLGTSARPLEINVPAYTDFWGGEAGLPLFPTLFVTIACGAISGFHALVASGTTAKQLNKESDARLIGYGGMLGEGMLAITAMAAVGVVAIEKGGGLAMALPNFATGGGVILTSFGVAEAYGAPFMGLVMVSFLLTSTDTAIRLGRYLMEELVGEGRGKAAAAVRNRYTAAGIQVVGGYLLLASGSWITLWALFGSANQLLAAIALLAGTVWLVNWNARKQLISTGLPTAVVGVITIASLVYLIFWENIAGKLASAAWLGEQTVGAIVSTAVQVALGLVLLGLALGLLWHGGRHVLRRRREGRGAPAAAATE